MEINTRSRTDLKAYFVKNAIPTESNFAELIDAMLNQQDDGLVKSKDDPLSIEAAGESVGGQPVINLYRNIRSPNPDWVLSLNPLADPNDPGSGQLGLAVNDGQGTSRLFIDQNTGHVGLGTTRPEAKLDVSGGLNAGALSIGPWPPNSGYVFFGANSLDQKQAGNYALLQDAAGDNTGRTFLNSPVDIRLRIDNQDRLVLANNGHVGLGTANPEARLQVINAPQDANGNTLILGPTTASNLRLGYHTNYSWIQSHSGKPLAINPLGNNVGIGTTNPSHIFHVVAQNAVGLFESTGDQAYLRLSSREGLDNRVEITNRPGGRLSLWTAGGKDVFNITRAGNVGVGTTNPQDKLDLHGVLRFSGNADRRIYGATRSNRNSIVLDGHWDELEVKGRVIDWTGDNLHIGYDNDHSDHAIYMGNNKLGRVEIQTDLIVTGLARAEDGLRIDGNRSNHLDTDGAIYRYKGQVYITVDDNLYIRDSKGKTPFHFNTNDGILKARDSPIIFSDIRLKKDISTLEDVLERFSKLRGVRFRWNEVEDGPYKIGLIAQEVEQVYPELVGEGFEGMKAINYSGFVPILIEAVKQQQAHISNLMKQNQAQQDQIETLISHQATGRQA